ncbi:MAG: hypothetical protein BWZ10_00408 [candidate division BRC1 bacterium ADurb.BinA364]|nr:MAG: hypothetical protein BWZ10_00408 [candidate division BRC1 bacterium ADurb.BinA364]
MTLQNAIWRRLLRAAAAGCALWIGVAAMGAAPIVRPYETRDDFAAKNRIDEIVLAKQRAEAIQPAHLCSDEVFLRRAYLDVAGTLPEPAELRAFLLNRRPDKRAALIDALLEREEFADYWSLKWCDLLRVKSEFPINLWPNATQAYHRWIRDAVRSNMPYDEFARALLTSSGSNFRVAPVNFCRAIQGRDPSSIAAAVALTFMGTRLETWPEADREGMAAFFSRILYKGTAEWKEEIVCLDPAATDTLKAAFPGGAAVEIPAGQDPRQVFADWLIDAENPWFARAIANRVWFWMMGRGIVHEPDDIRPGNPPSNPELLEYLADELEAADYDLRHLFRLILNSRTYQQSSIPQAAGPKAEALFAWYPVRRLDAEVLVDALNWLAGAGDENYISMIPEPFTYIPPTQRTIALADGSISSPFLEMFGRPARDTGLELERNNQPTEAQRLHLLNSTEVQRALDNSRRLRGVISAAGRDRAALIRGLYATILTRQPTEEEIAIAERVLPGRGAPSRQAVSDLAWALVNSKEFLYRH